MYFTYKDTQEAFSERKIWRNSEDAPSLNRRKNGVKSVMSWN